MYWFKRNPIFYLILSLMMAGVVVGMWIASERRNQLAQLKTDYDAKSAAFERYVTRKPAPTKANFEAIDSNFRMLLEKYDRSKAILNLNTYDRKYFFESSPASKTDAFFEIARYVEDARNAAQGNRIRFDQGNRFGFNKYANVGPEEADIAPIHRQVKVMRYLLVQALFESGISEFEYIKRDVGNNENEEALRKNGPRSPSPDEFTFNPDVSSEIEGIVDSMAFEVSFVGQSISLRNFLNIVVNSSLPFVVKAVEVDLVDAEANKESNHRTLADNPFVNPEIGDELIEAAQIPIISENQSRFVVTIEFLETNEAFEESIALLREGEGDNA